MQIEIQFKERLACNAAACIITRNHPSGVADPSTANRAITESLKATLKLVEIRILDHMIIAGSADFSFAEQSLI